MDTKQEGGVDQRLVDLTRAIQVAYGSKKYLFWRSFLAGLFSGLGATIGVAIVLAAIAYLVRHLGGLPVIGDWLNALGNILPSN